MATITKGTGSVIIKGLSSFWTRLFKDSAVLDSLYSATETMLGDVYLDLMESVLSKSIRNTPVFSRRDWKLLLVTNTDSSFDSPSFSQDSTTVVGPKITVIAQELSQSHDGQVFELADADNLGAEKRVLYPTHGIFNSGIVTGSAVRENLWVAVVPSGKTVYESIQQLSRRVVTNKRLTATTVEKKNSVQGLSDHIRALLSYQGTWTPITTTLPTASSENAGYYYEAVQNHDNWLVGDWAVSDGTQWVRCPLEEPSIIFKYGSEYTPEIKIPVGTYPSAEDLKDALDLAIQGINAAASVPYGLTTEIDGGYLLIHSDKDIVVWDSNTAFEEQLFIKTCRFKFLAEIPPGREADFYWNQRTQIQLLTKGYSPSGVEYRFPIDHKCIGAKYIYNTLYSPSLILEEGRHYRISNGYIYFKQNPFDLDRVAFRDFGDGRRQLALWMGDVSVDKLDLYYNYGYRFTKLLPSSEAYKNFIRGLYYYYTHGPQVERLRSAFNILAGIPVCENNNELVAYVAPNGLTVVTDQNTYELDAKTPAVVTVGDTLQAFDTLTDAFVVEDYINNPNWYDKIVIPDYLMPSASIGLRTSSVTAFVPTVGDTGFIIGDLTTDYAELITNAITRDTNDYSLASPAYFEIERDNSGDTYPVYVPESLTAGAASLDAMVSYIKLALRQMISDSVNGAGSTKFQLLTDAEFTIGHNSKTYAVVIPASDTAGCTDLASLAVVVKAKIDAAVGSSVISVYPYEDEDSFVFIPTTDVEISVSDLNVSARAELGLYPFKSLSGVTVTKSGTSIKFVSNTVGAKSRLRISNMNAVALEDLAMEPFRQGSGDYIGDDGDPTPGWEIMDKYLKFNTFRIRYDAGAISFSDDAPSIQSIVMSGRPLYTSAMVSPEFSLRDTISVYPDNVVDVPSFLEGLSESDVLVADRKIYDKVTVNISEPYAQCYTRDQDKPYNYVAGSATSLYEFEDVSESGGSILLKSTSDTVEYAGHKIEMTDVNHLIPADQVAFSSYGIYNRGNISNGITIPQMDFPQGSVGGLYFADPNGNSNFGHWVQGFDLADLHPSVTHVLVVDQVMKDTGFDPISMGISEGSFMTLSGMLYGTNNGEFAILNVYRGAKFKRQNISVDLLFFANKYDALSPEENYLVPNVTDKAKISFRPGSDTANNSWIVIFPGSGTIDERISGVLIAVGDDREIFPFYFSFLQAPGDTNVWVPPPSGSYYTGIVHGGNTDYPTTFGHLYKLSFDSDPAHDDSEAQLIASGGSLPHGHTLETRSMVLTRGNANWGRETYDHDPDSVGQLSRDFSLLTHPYFLREDKSGLSIYCDYDSLTKLNNTTGLFVKLGEISFERTIKFYLTNEAPTDKAEYYGANLRAPVTPVSESPRVWPSGNTSTYRSYNWKGYWLSAFNLMGEYSTTKPLSGVIGGGSPPNTPAPAEYKIHTADTEWTLEVGRVLVAKEIEEHLPSPTPLVENNAYTVKLRTNLITEPFDAPAEADHYLLEPGDWIYCDGDEWVRSRYVGSFTENILLSAGNRVFEQWTVGEHSVDPYCAVVGANFIVCHSRHSNYNIYTNGSRWTKVIGARTIGDLPKGGYYDYLNPVKFYGYGPVRLDGHSVPTTIDNTELSEIFDWSQDSSLGTGGPAYSLFRVVQDAGSLTVYAQVEEQDLNNFGVTISKVPGVNLSSDTNAIRIHYFDINTGDWATDTLSDIDGNAVTSDEFTIRVVELLDGRKKLRLWNGVGTSAPFDAESTDLDPYIADKHRLGKVLVSIKLDYSGSYSKLTDYIQGMITQKERLSLRYM